MYYVTTSDLSSAVPTTTRLCATTLSSSIPRCRPSANSSPTRIDSGSSIPFIPYDYNLEPTIFQQKHFGKAALYNPIRDTISPPLQVSQHYAFSASSRALDDPYIHWCGEHLQQDRCTRQKAPSHQVPIYKLATAATVTGAQKEK